MNSEYRENHPIQKYFLILILFILLGLSESANAEKYIGVDVTSMRFDVDYTNGFEEYEFNQIRLKFGILWESVGLEIQALLPSDDTILDPFGLNFKIEVDAGVGAFAKLVTEQRGAYLLFGVTLLDTKYTGIAAGQTDSDKVLALGLGFGLQLQPIKNLYVSLDYMHIEGKADYSTFISGGEADIKFSGAGVGINYAF